MLSHNQNLLNIPNISIYNFRTKESSFYSNIFTIFFLTSLMISIVNRSRLCYVHETRDDFPRKTIIKPQQIRWRIEFLCFVGDPRSHRCSSISYVHRKLLAIGDHHRSFRLIRTRRWARKNGYRSDLPDDSYQLTFIDDEEAYSARTVQI